MTIFISPIGTQFRLDADWTFPLYNEYRNQTLWIDTFAENPPRTDCWTGLGEPRPLTLKKGTFLSVDRIYIRKGQKEFDSISFKILKGSPGPMGRFWAKLDDVNFGMPPVTLLTA